MATKQMFLLNATDAEGIPSVEIYDSVEECIDSVCSQAKISSPAMLALAKKALSARREWVDEAGTKFEIVKSGRK